MKSYVRLGGLKEAPASIGGDYFTINSLKFFCKRRCKKMVKDTVDTVVDQAANFVEKKVAEKNTNTAEKKDDKK